MLFKRKTPPLSYAEKTLKKALNRWQSGPYLVARAGLRREMEQLVAHGWELVEGGNGMLKGTTTSGTWTMRLPLAGVDEVSLRLVGNDAQLARLVREQWKVRGYPINHPRSLPRQRDLIGHEGESRGEF